MATGRLTFVEATAALAQACRHRRLSDDELVDLRRELEDYRLEIDVIEIDDELIRQSADAAVRYRLRGYDAVHCSAAERVADAELFAAAGDQQQLAAWRELGIAVADTTNVPSEPRPA